MSFKNFKELETEKMENINSEIGKRFKNVYNFRVIKKGKINYSLSRIIWYNGRYKET